MTKKISSSRGDARKKSTPKKTLDDLSSDSENEKDSGEEEQVSTMEPLTQTFCRDE